MSNDLTPLNDTPISIGSIANAYSEALTFPTYQQRLARYTLRRQKSELSTFAKFLTAAGLRVSVEDLHGNPSAWSDKLEWVKINLGDGAYKRLILTHHKNLNKGDFLVDDRQKNGAGEFAGELILFGSERFPDWPAVTKYLLDKL